MRAAGTSGLLKRMKRNFASAPCLHLAATGSIAFALLIIGIFFLLFVNINNAAEKWQKNIRIIAYLKDPVRQKDLASLRQRLAEMPAVSQVQFVSKQQAWQQLKIQLAHRQSLLDGLSENPLPASFEVRLADTPEGWKRVASLAGQIEALAGVDQVEYGQAWLKRFSGFMAFFRLTALVVGILVLAAGVFICANTIRLTLYARREEFEIMRLVGATDVFIKAPFYVQNIVEGLLAGLVALGLLFCIHEFFVARVQHQEIMLSTFQITFIPLSGVVGVLWVGVFMGWLGSYISLKQFLRH